MAIFHSRIHAPENAVSEQDCTCRLQPQSAADVMPLSSGRRFSSSESPITETEPVVMAITPIIG